MKEGLCTPASVFVWGDYVTGADNSLASAWLHERRFVLAPGVPVMRAATATDMTDTPAASTDARRTLRFIVGTSCAYLEPILQYVKLEKVCCVDSDRARHRSHVDGLLEAYPSFAATHALDALRAPNIQRSTRVVRLEPDTTKNDEAREFPFAVLPDLAVLLADQREVCDQLKRQGVICARVFHRNGRPIRNFRTVWSTAYKAAGCRGRIPHDFRRTAMRNLVRAGFSEKVAMTLTGHKTPSVFDRYHIVSGTDTREAVAKLAGTLTGTISELGRRSASVKSA